MKNLNCGIVQLASLKSFHVRLMSIVFEVDVEPTTTPWDPAKAYLFVPVVGDKSEDPVKEIDWVMVRRIIQTDAWNNPLQRARPDVYLGTNERALGGDRREYGFGKLRHGMAFGQKSHPTYGIRGAVAQFDVVKASGLVPDRGDVELQRHPDQPKGKLLMADTSMAVEDLVGRIVTAAHSGKRFYVDSIRYDTTAENSFPRKEGYLGPLEYSSYADYYKQKYRTFPFLNCLMVGLTSCFLSSSILHGLYSHNAMLMLCWGEKFNSNLYWKNIMLWKFFTDWKSFPFLLHNKRVAFGYYVFFIQVWS